MYKANNKNIFSRYVLLCLVILFQFSRGFSQQLPDFSGDWVLNPDESKLEAYWTANLTDGNIKIAHEEPDFSFWRSFTIKNKDRITSYKLITDGQEQKGKHHTFWRLYWQQNTLVLIVRRHGIAIDSVRYSLSTDRLKLTADENVDTPTLTYHNLWIFVRRSLSMVKE